MTISDNTHEYILIIKEKDTDLDAGTPNKQYKLALLPDYVTMIVL